MKIKLPSFSGEIKRRVEPCRLCHNDHGLQIGIADYWNLQTSSLIQCTQCGLIQLDPMLTTPAMAKGCEAYYYLEKTQSTYHENERNLLRNFRRGLLFGFQLKAKGYAPSEILEFGPGTGHFCAGLKHVFPGANITVMDIVEEVLKMNQELGFTTRAGSPEDTSTIGNQTFDLIVARDILEHVANIGEVLNNVTTLLNPGGLFHFITPNGREDVWKHYVYNQLHHRPSELLINHVNYFDGEGLERWLEQHKLEKVEYYTYKIKPMLKGKGRSLTMPFAASPSQKRSADETMQKLRAISVHDQSNFPTIGHMIHTQWYLRTRFQCLTHLICWYHHQPIIKLNPRKNLGHEIYGLFKKRIG